MQVKNNKSLFGYQKIISNVRVNFSNILRVRKAGFNKLIFGLRKDCFFKEQSPQKSPKINK